MKPFLAGLFLLLVSLQVQAVLTIEINEAEATATPVAIAPFAGEARAPQKISQIVAFDLRRSGRFKALPVEHLPELPLTVADIHYERWVDTGSDVLLLGDIRKNGDGTWRVQATLVDLLRRQVMFAHVWDGVTRRAMRRVAHQIADRMYEALTGVPGAFDTRVAYVLVEQRGGKTRYSLNVADSDGYNERPVLRSYEPIMSPAWSPDGNKLAYVSFENGRSEVYIQDLRTAKRQRVAAYPGINSAPAWSPDGKKLALTLSKAGSADIYILDLRTKQLRRLTRHWAIETEAAWSPDGKFIYFTSDRRGQPQIFRASLETGEVERVTFEGTYNANPVISPNGRYLAMVTASPGQGYHIGLLDLQNGDFRVLTRTFLDESPSFAPNGEMILYAMQRGGRGQLAVVSTEGGTSQYLKVQRGDVKEPDWGPYRY